MTWMLLWKICLVAVLGVFEYVAYRPIIFLARWRGVTGFIRGDKSWQKFERNPNGSNGSNGHNGSNGSNGANRRRPSPPAQPKPAAATGA